MANEPLQKSIKRFPVKQVNKFNWSMNHVNKVYCVDRYQSACLEWQMINYDGEERIENDQFISFIRHMPWEANKNDKSVEFEAQETGSSNGVRHSFFNMTNIWSKCLIHFYYWFVLLSIYSPSTNPEVRSKLCWKMNHLTKGHFSSESDTIAAIRNTTR